MTRFAICLLLLLLAGCGDDPAPPAASAEPPRAEAPAAVSCIQAAGQLCPVDEGAADASFSAYRTRLLQAVEQKDVEGVIALLDPQLRTDFGGGGGIADFRRHWRLDSSPEQSPLWNELGEILRLGGSFLKTEGPRGFWAPYVYSNWPEGFDAFGYVAAIRNGVALREKPDTSPSSTATLDWSVLRLVEETKPGAQWLHVETTDGKQGWVAADDVRSPIDYRAGFNETNGDWKMTALVAGD